MSYGPIAWYGSPVGPPSEFTIQLSVEVTNNPSKTAEILDPTEVYVTFPLEARGYYTLTDGSVTLPGTYDPGVTFGAGFHYYASGYFTPSNDTSYPSEYWFFDSFQESQFLWYFPYARSQGTFTVTDAGAYVWTVENTPITGGNEGFIALANAGTGGGNPGPAALVSDFVTMTVTMTPTGAANLLGSGATASGDPIVSDLSIRVVPEGSYSVVNIDAGSVTTTPVTSIRDDYSYSLYGGQIAGRTAHSLYPDTVSGDKMVDGREGEVLVKAKSAGGVFSEKENIVKVSDSVIAWVDFVDLYIPWEDSDQTEVSITPPDKFTEYSVARETVTLIDGSEVDYLHYSGVYVVTGQIGDDGMFDYVDHAFFSDNSWTSQDVCITRMGDSDTYAVGALILDGGYWNVGARCFDIDENGAISNVGSGSLVHAINPGTALTGLCLVGISDACMVFGYQVTLTPEPDAINSPLASLSPPTAYGCTTDTTVTVTNRYVAAWQTGGTITTVSSEEKGFRYPNPQPLNTPPDSYDDYYGPQTNVSFRKNGVRVADKKGLILATNVWADGEMIVFESNDTAKTISWTQSTFKQSTNTQRVLSISHWKGASSEGGFFWNHGSRGVMKLSGGYFAYWYIGDGRSLTGVNPADSKEESLYKYQSVVIQPFQLDGSNLMVESGSPFRLAGSLNGAGIGAIYSHDNIFSNDAGDKVAIAYNHASTIQAEGDQGELNVDRWRTTSGYYVVLSFDSGTVSFDVEDEIGFTSSWTRVPNFQGDGS